MNVLPIDLTAITGIVMGSLMVLIPVAGLTARFALKPVVEALALARGGPGAEGEVRALRQQVAHLQEQLQGMETQVKRLRDESDFQRQIGTPVR